MEIARSDEAHERAPLQRLRRVRRAGGRVARGTNSLRAIARRGEESKAEPSRAERRSLERRGPHLTRVLNTFSCDRFACVRRASSESAIACGCEPHL